MSLWKTNSALLEKQYAGLREEILLKDDIDSRDIEIETSSSGHVTLKFRGIYIHSPRDPVREGRRLAESIAESPPAGAANTGTNKPASPVIILGLGLGYAAQAAGELLPDRPLIIVEKYPSLLRIALEQRDLQSLLARPNVVFVTGGREEGITGALSLFEQADAENSTENPSPYVIRNRGLVGLDKEWYGGIESRIRSWTMRGDVNTATLKRFGKRWIINLSRNMSAIRDKPGISRLEGLASGDTLPVFLAAAGPGLDQAGELLAEIRERCIVVAVDTSLRFLLARGIVPDFAVMVDPQFWNSRHLDRLSIKNIRLIAESAVYPAVLRLPFRETYLCSSLFPLGSFIEKQVDPKGSLGAGGSVATTAWDFCRILGAQNIWIAGLDLAYPGLKTHFRGAAFEENSHTQSGRLSPTETWLSRALRDGLPFPARAEALPSGPGGANPDSTVLTDRRLSLYAAWFENRFIQYPDIHNYSLSSGGLAIAGLEYTTPEKILALPCRRQEIDLRLKDAYSCIEADFFSAEGRRVRAENYEKAVFTLIQGLAHIRAAAIKGADIAQKALLYNPGRAEQKKLLTKLDEISQSIANSEVKEIAGFLFPPQEAVDMNKETGNPFQTYLKSSKRLYCSLIEAVEFNLNVLKTGNN